MSIGFAQASGLWLVLTVLSFASGPENRVQQQPRRASASRAADHLARLDAANQPIPRGWVRQIDDAFDALEARCWQTRGVLGQEASIGDMVYRAVRELRQAKIRMTHLEFVLEMTQATPFGETAKTDCAQVATSVGKAVKDRAQ